MFPKQFSDLHSLLRAQRLHDALATATQLTDAYPALAANKEQLQDLSLQHRLMGEALLNGFDDPQRNALYGKAMDRLQHIAADMQMQWFRTYEPAAAAHAAVAREYRFDVETIRETLEHFVARKALLTLGNDGASDAQSADVIARHYHYRAALFRHLWLDGQWREDEAAEYAQMITSPTVDSDDAQLMVSALTLSLLTVFDVRKFDTLIYIYLHSQDERVRQRSLVGIAFSVTHAHTISHQAPSKPPRGEASPSGDFPLGGMRGAFTTQLHQLLDDEDASQQLVETQMQMFYCLSAEDDNAEIQREIIPTLMKNSPVIMQDGQLIEREDDELNDILNPHAEEEAAEEVEASMRRMMDMQKSGVDVFFGGFSQMKRFPFFHDLVNWFMPFSLDHPALAAVCSKGEQATTLIRLLLDRGPFCDSDKYSFTLVMEQTIDKMPPNLMEAIGAAESEMEMQHAGERNNPSYIRRAYLQDLFRFFRLQRDRNLFSTPFSATNAPSGTSARSDLQSDRFPPSPLFLAHPLLRGAEGVRQRAVNVASFLYRRKQWKALCEWGEVFSLPLLHALALQRLGRMTESMPLLNEVLQAQPDNQRAMSALARCHFNNAHYAEALPLYARLHQAKPESRAYAMRYIVCLVEEGKEEEALKKAYELQYNHSDDDDVNRVFGWTLLMSGQADKAAATFLALCKAQTPQPTDMLHCAYCHWFSGKRKEALAWLQQYAQTEAPDDDAKRRTTLKETFARDSRLFRLYHVDSIEQQLIVDLAT